MEHRWLYCSCPSVTFHLLESLLRLPHPFTRGLSLGPRMHLQSFLHSKDYQVCEVFHQHIQHSRHFSAALGKHRKPASSDTIHLYHRWCDPIRESHEKQRTQAELELRVLWERRLHFVRDSFYRLMGRSHTVTTQAAVDWLLMRSGSNLRVICGKRIQHIRVRATLLRNPVLFQLFRINRSDYA